MKKIFNWDAKNGMYINENGLTPYHLMRNAEAIKAVEETMKNPLSHEQVKAQIERLRIQKNKSL